MYVFTFSAKLDADIFAYSWWIIVIEKSNVDAPIYHASVQDAESPLRQYTGIPDHCLTILGPRRVPGILPPAHNTNSSVVVSTSVGFRFLKSEEYDDAVKTLRADVSVALADVIDPENASVKRIGRSADRTHAWLRDSVENPGRDRSLPLFAAIPPVESQLLSLYLSDLQTEYRSQISGLCIHSVSTLAALPEELRQLPVIFLSDPPTPQALLAAIYAGIDLAAVPFVTRSSEHGIGLSFSFPGSIETFDKPLGSDLWSTVNATDLSTLSPGCRCYTCQRHHRAFVHHLLQAGEMLAWTLLQIHNYTVIDSFFESVRQSIERGSFDKDVETFGRAYASEIPKSTGKRPTVRGYQMKSVGGGEPKKNSKAYGKLDDQMQKLAEAESGIATPDGDADDIEEHGLAKKMG